MFDNGTEWIRADFHLHTRADKEFSYLGDDDRFISDYIDALKEQQIKMGVITNHNKFNLSEYKGLKKKAKKNGIMLLPGVELSVKEGSNGIHCLIVFKNEDWISGDTEKINQFLDEVFKGIDNREKENTRCNMDLEHTVKCLDSYNNDYFIMMAHIEQKSGFLKECNGGLITSLSSKKWFKDNILGLQKGRARKEMKKLKGWMGYEIPYIEGSDCKSVEDIGKGNPCYIKIGDGNFDSVVLAFKDNQNRISLSQKKYNHGYIKSIQFIGGKLDAQEILLSPELNSLIGIRGSGKSSIIESIRYALDIAPSTADKEYKNDVVKNLLESGGQIILNLQDDYGKEYKVKRVYGETPHILDHNDKEINISINTILQTPLYFGQKDLSYMDSGYELNLLNKLVGENLSGFEESLRKVNNRLNNDVSKLLDLEEEIEKIPELENSLSDIRHKIKIFEDKGLAEKLIKQVNFQKDKNKIQRINKLITDFYKEIQLLMQSNIVADLEKSKNFSSIEVPNIATKVDREVNKTLQMKDKIEKIAAEITTSSNLMTEYLKDIQETINSLEEEFAEVKREIDIPNLDPDDFSKYKMSEEKIAEKIRNARSKSEKKIEIRSKIKGILEERNNVLLDEFNKYKKSIEEINSNQSALQLSIEFKGNKAVFLNDLIQNFKGTGINQTSYKAISENFSDFTALVEDVLVDNSKRISDLISDTQLLKLKERVRTAYSKLINIRTNNKIEINYHGKPIAKHSIGQRASALVLFILSQKKNNLIIIDQPEDDLDNQVIYNEIITNVKSRKANVQFIFATHNANIPVLGDSEQIIAVSYDEKQIITEIGSIDKKKIQTKIVDIMEGGQEAFSKRTQIYNLWQKG
ncbi:MAG: TrlF family AAA-like ATPase [Latilactobacillus sakei]|nr:hypothetical protein [Latilactobacillus sakei]SOB40370.1 conserved hypothetical protein [Latilactobacillus sakei]